MRMANKEGSGVVEEEMTPPDRGAHMFICTETGAVISTTYALIHIRKKDWNRKDCMHLFFKPKSRLQAYELAYQ